MSSILPPPGGHIHIPDIPNWSWQEYGMRVGFWRFHEALTSRGIPATLSVNGSVCTQYSRLAQAAHEAGWEFLGHAYHQRPTHLIEDQPQDIRDTMKAIEDFTGKPPRGYEKVDGVFGEQVMFEKFFPILSNAPPTSSKKSFFFSRKCDVQNI